MVNYLTEIDQGTEEWFAIRAGLVTASEFSTVLSKGRGSQPSKGRRTYMLKLAGERLTGTLMDSFSNVHMERGKEMEAEARGLYTLTTGNEVEECGFITRGDDVGYSTDGLVGEKGLIEIKTKLPHLQIDVLLKKQMPPEHMAQCQGGLWVSEREWLDFISYWPGLPIFIYRVTRDEKYIKTLAEEVEKFVVELKEVVQTIRRGP